MARPRKNSSESLDLSHGQSHYVLGRLIGDRRVTSSEVKRYVGEMHSEIQKLEERLQSLRSAAGSVITSAIQKIRRGPGRPPGSGTSAVGSKKRRKRSSALTAEQRESRRLQGQYLGLIRQIPATRRAQYQKIVKEKGREAAIKEMRSNLNK